MGYRDYGRSNSHFNSLLAGILLLLFSAVPGFSESFEDLYAQWSQAAGIDPNAGLTSFLTLTIPPGGLYEGMGTAYTAAAMDSGYIEANPAASSVLNLTQLSLYHNNWIGNTNVESAVYTLRRGETGYGFAVKMLYVPFTGLNAWGERYRRQGYEQYATGYYSETIGTFNISHNFFSNYYFHGLAAGVNLKTAFRSVPEAIYDGQNGIALMGDIGLLTKFNFLKFYYSRDRNLSLGVNGKNLGFARLTSSPGKADDPLPSKITAGLGWSPLRPVTLSADYNHPLNLANPALSELPYGAFGFHLQVTDFSSLHSGFILKTGAPRLSLGSGLQFKHSSLVMNYSLDLTTQGELFDRISLEAKIDLGDLGRLDRKNRVQDIYLKGLEEYARGNYRLAISLWEDALALDSDFTPAREMVETTRKILQLQEEMEEQQKVE